MASAPNRSQVKNSKPEGQVLQLSALMVIAILASIVLCSFGMPLWLLLIVGALPWLVFWSSRRGVAFAVASVILTSFWALLVTTMITGLAGLPMNPTIIAVWSAVGLGGTAACLRHPDVFRAPSAMSMAVWIPAALGGLIWIGAMLAAAVIPGASRISWVLAGDSANNVLFARELIYRGGIGIGPNENPVPLPSAILGVIMESGRGAINPQELLRHDLTALTQTWSLLIALTCLLVGAVAASIARRTSKRPTFVALVSGAASLVPLSWFFTGYPIEFGFLVTHLALPIVLAAFVVYLQAQQSPVQVLAMLAMSATLLLAVWSPLVLMSAGLGLVIVIRQWRVLLATRGVALGLLLLSFAQLLGYGLLIVLPSFLRLSGALAAAGGIFGFRRWMIVALAVGALAVAAVTFRRITDAVVLGVFAMVAASAVGLALLLFASRNVPDPWTYYPVKFAWLAAAIIFVLILGLIPAFLARYVRSLLVQIVSLAVFAIFAISFLVWAPTSGNGYVIKNPIVRILQGESHGDGDKVAERIIELADPDRPQLLWQSGDPFEGTINFWLLQMAADSTTENLQLRVFAYGTYDPEEVADLCSIVEASPRGMTIHTTQSSLERELNAECTGVDADFVVEP